MIQSAIYYFRHFGLAGLKILILTKLTRSRHFIEARVPGIREPFTLRTRTSDLPTFHQVYVREEYEFQANQEPRTIVDAGANIGLASILFANRYPKARIIALEPEPGNFEMLKRNAAPYPNITPVQAALWDKEESIALVDPGLGEWAFETVPESRNAMCKVQGLTVDAVMRNYRLDRINILKIDIEGSEREVFKDTSAWLDRVDSLIVELHDRIRPGCTRSFYNGTNGLDDEWVRGENVYLARHGYLSKA